MSIPRYLQPLQTEADLFQDGKRLVTLIPGDGIGPEISRSVCQIFAAANVPIAWEEVNVTPILTPEGKTTIPPDALKSVNRNKIALKGPLATPIGKGHVSLNLTLRRTFDLYANLRPCKSIVGYKTPFENVNTVLIRENTEGEYSGIEHEVVPGVVQSIKLITEAASRRCIQYAFNHAKSSGRPRVTVVHKATVQKQSDGLFLSVAQEMAKEYPEIKLDDILLDRACLQVVSALLYLPCLTLRSSKTQPSLRIPSWLCPTCTETFSRICALV